MIRYKDRSQKIRNPRSIFQKEMRLRELEDKQENDELDRSKRSELFKLRRQIHNPTIRQRLFGFKPGRLRQEDEEFLEVMSVSAKIQKLMKDFMTEVDMKGLREETEWEHT